jgi:hypothetical protein
LEKEEEMKKTHVYFSNDGSMETALGPEPRNGINYEKEWNQEHPRMDNGEIMYGMFTLLNGDFSNGHFTPGYGLPLSPSPFESTNSFIYRLWQWTRTIPLLIFIIPGILCFLCLITLNNGVVSSFFAYAFGYSLAYTFLIIPLLVVYAIYMIFHLAHSSKESAKREIENKIYNDDDVRVIVEQYYCPVCNTHTLHYHADTNEVSCGAGHGPWRIAY